MAKDLFGGDLFTPIGTPVTNSLFASRSPAITAKHMQEQQAQQEEQAWMAAVTRDVDSILASEKWNNASLVKKKELLDNWETNKWKPWLNSRFGDDVKAKDKAEDLGIGRIRASLKEAEETFKSSSRTVDAALSLGKGTLGFMDMLGNQVARGVTQGNIALQNLFGNAEAVQEARDWAQRVTESSQRVTDNLNQGWQEKVVATRPRLTETQKRMGEYMTAGSGQFGANMRTIADYPSHALNLFAEQIPNMAPIAAAAGLSGGLAAPAATGALMGSGFDMDELAQNLYSIPDDQLWALPEARRMLESNPNLTPNDIRFAMLQSALLGTASRGAIIGALAGAGGVEAALGRVGLTSAIMGAVPNRLVRGAVGAGVGALGEGLEEAAQQMNVNQGLRVATGDVSQSLTEGALDAGLMGAFFGAPFGALAGVTTPRREAPPTVTPPTPTETRLQALPAPTMIDRLQVGSYLQQTLAPFNPRISQAEIQAVVNTITSDMPESGITVGTLQNLLADTRSQAEAVIQARYPDDWAEQLTAIRDEIQAERAKARSQQAAVQTEAQDLEDLFAFRQAARAEAPNLFPVSPPGPVPAAEAQGVPVPNLFGRPTEAQQNMEYTGRPEGVDWTYGSDQFAPVTSPDFTTQGLPYEVLEGELVEDGQPMLPGAETRPERLLPLPAAMVPTRPRTAPSAQAAPTRPALPAPAEVQPESRPQTAPPVYNPEADTFRYIGLDFFTDPETGDWQYIRNGKQYRAAPYIQKMLNEAYPQVAPVQTTAQAPTPASLAEELNEQKFLGNERAGTVEIAEQSPGSDRQVAAPAGEPGPAVQPVDAQAADGDGGAAQGPGAGRAAQPDAGAALGNAENNQQMGRRRRRIVRPGAVDAGTGSEPATSGRVVSDQTGQRADSSGSAADAGQSETGRQPVKQMDMPPETVTAVRDKARKMAGKFVKGKSEEIQKLREDLEGEALLAAMEQWGKFDPEQGAQFTTFAGRAMAGAMYDLANQRKLKVVLNPREAYVRNHLDQASRSLPETERNNYELLAQALTEYRAKDPRVSKVETYTAEDIAGELGRRDTMNVGSLDAPLSTENDGGVTGDMVADQNAVNAEEALMERASAERLEAVQEQLRLFADVLDGREKVLLENRLLDEPRTGADFAKEWGVSRQRVNQLMKSMEKKVRERLAWARGSEGRVFRKSSGQSYKQFVEDINAFAESLKQKPARQSTGVDSSPEATAFRENLEGIWKDNADNSPDQALPLEEMISNIDDLRNYAFGIELARDTGRISLKLSQDLNQQNRRAILDQIFQRPDAAEDLAAYDRGEYIEELTEQFIDYGVPEDIAYYNAVVTEKLFSPVAALCRITPRRIGTALGLREISDATVELTGALGEFKPDLFEVYLENDSSPDGFAGPKLYDENPTAPAHEYFHAMQWVLFNYDRDKLSAMAADFETMAQEAGISPDQDIYDWHGVWLTPSDSNALTHVGLDSYMRKPLENAAFQLEDFLQTSEVLPDEVREAAEFIRNILDAAAEFSHDEGTPLYTEAMGQVFARWLEGVSYGNTNARVDEESSGQVERPVSRRESSGERGLGEKYSEHAQGRRDGQHTLRSESLDGERGQTAGETGPVGSHDAGRNGVQSRRIERRRGGRNVQPKAGSGPGTGRNVSDSRQPGGDGAQVLGESNGNNLRQHTEVSVPGRGGAASVTSREETSSEAFSGTLPDSGFRSGLHNSDSGPFGDSTPSRREGSDRPVLSESIGRGRQEYVRPGMSDNIRREAGPYGSPRTTEYAAESIIKSTPPASKQRELNRLSEAGALPATLAEARDAALHSSDELAAAADTQLAERDPAVLAQAAPPEATAAEAMDAAVYDELHQRAAGLSDPSPTATDPTTNETHLDDPSLPDAPIPAPPLSADWGWIAEGRPLWQSINATLATEDPPSTARSNGPAPKVDQLALAALQAERKAAAGQAPTDGNGLARTPINPKENLDNWRSKGVWLRAKLEDAGAYFRVWAAKVQNVGDGHPEDTPFHRALSLMPAETRQAYARISDDLLKPIMDWLDRKSRDSGLDMTTLFERAGQAATVRHILNEGEQIYHQALIDEAAETRASYEEDPNEEARGEMLEAQAALETYERYQEAMDSGQEWDGPVPRMAGGLSTAERRAERAELLKTFSETEFDEIADLISQAFEGLTLERLRAGTLLQADLDSWAPFTQYVPLSTKIQVNQLTGDQMAGWIFNPSRADYRRNGSTTPAENALALLWKAADRTSLEVGGQTFRQELNSLYNALEAAGNTHGLLKIPMDELGRRIRSLNPEIQNNGLRLNEAPGYIYRERYVDADGQTRTRSFKFTFDLGRTEKEQADNAILRKSMAEVQNHSAILKTMAGGTRAVGQFYTKFRPAFAPINMVRDFGERAINTIGHADFKRADGSTVSGAAVVREMGRNSWGKFKGYVASQIRGQGSDSRYGRLWDEFRASGANYTVLNMTQSMREESNKAVPPLVRGAVRKFVSQLPGMRGAEAIGRKVNEIINRWNDFFNSLPTFFQYVALRESGVSSRDAAAYTLDMMNYYKRGEWEPAASAFWPFFRPTVQGGVNMLRTLSPLNKNKATRFRGAMAVSGLSLAGLMITGMLRELAGEDEESGLNRYDQIPFSQLTGFIPLFNEDGSYIKVPIAFGAGQLAWTASQIIDRVDRGLMDPLEGAGRLTMSFHKQVLPDAYPDYSPKEDPLAWILQTFTPQPVRPFVDVAVNRNYWGGQIKYGNRTPGLRDFEKGRKSTPTRWHYMAKEIYDGTGGFLDITPESLRHVFNYYMAGPLQGMTAAIEADRLNKSTETTRDKLGPFLTAMGGSMGWSAPQNVNLTYYYQAKREIEAELTKRGAASSSPDNKAGDKAPFVRREMRKAGFAEEEINRYLDLLAYQKELDKLDRDFNQRYKSLKFSELDEDRLRRDFERWNRDRQIILDRAARRIHSYDRR